MTLARSSTALFTGTSRKSSTLPWLLIALAITTTGGQPCGTGGGGGTCARQMAGRQRLARTMNRAMLALSFSRRIRQQDVGQLLLLIPRIVGRVDVLQGPGADAMQLDDRFA